MSDFLQQMAAASAVRATASKINAADLDLPTYPLKLQGFDLIAEIKDASPSEGVLTDGDTDRKKRALEYARGGAAAISVLTEPSKFAGDITHVREVVDVVAGLNMPVMRKDFLTEPVQILEARAAGASGVLLIAALLTDSSLRTMLAVAYEYSMFVLLEAFDEDDLRRCTRLLSHDRHMSRAENRELLIGVNTRNLRTLEVNPKRLGALSSLLPRNVTCVAESGLKTANDAVDASRLGYKMALVGTALMKSTDPATLITAMRDAGRRRAAN